MLRNLGGKGSGNFGHQGRKGEVGGSSSGGDSATSYSNTPGDFTPGSVQEAVSDYVSGTDESYAYVLNAALRSGEALSKADKDLVSRLDHAIQGSRLERDTVLYRGGVLPDGIQEGQVFKDRAYVSTTEEKYVARDYFTGAKYGNEDARLIQVQVSKGTPALNINRVMGKDWEQHYEHEILLGRGTRFKVLSVTPKLVTIKVLR